MNKNTNQPPPLSFVERTVFFYCTYSIFIALAFIALCAAIQ